MDSFSASEAYSVYTYWRDERVISSFEDEMHAELEEIAKKQKTTKSNTKIKGPTTPTSSVAPKIIPTTTVVKPGGEKLLTIAQATENTVKRA
jgi:hypothetical protein